MSIAEARRALWSHVPDSVKEYVRPIAQEAAKEMDKVIPPDTEIPKPVEALATHPVETLTTAVQNPAQTLKDVSDVVSTAKPAMSNAAAAIGRTVKQKAKEKLRDYTMESVGELKGIVLEATNIVDTLAWLPYAEHQLARKIVGTGASADALMAANDFLTDYAALNAISEKFGLSETDATGKPTGGFAVSGAVSKKFDVGADKLEAAFGSVPKEEALIFTSYEKGELEGAIGSQVALAFVGVEEVQLVLKAVGAIGGIEGIVQTIQRDPEGWSKNPAFWGAVLNTVLSVIGLKSARAGRKIINIAIASGGVLNAVPAVWQIYNDYTDAKLAQKTEERDKKLKDDLKNLIKILSSVAMEIARHGAAKRTTEPTPGTQEGVGTAPSTQPREPSAGVQGGTAATPTEAAPPSPPQPVTGAGAEASSPAVQPSEASLRTQGPPEATTTATPTGSVAAPSGLELAEEPQPTRPVTHGEIDMGPQTPSGLELDRGPKPTRDVPFGERDLGPVPPGKGLQVYEGSKPIDKIPGVRKVQPTFGEASTEKAGTESRSGMSFHELNAAEIVQGLNLNYDPVAGRTRSVSYRVDTATVSEAAVTERTFTRDLSIEGAQSKDSVYTNSGYERGHLAQREAFKGQAETEQAADHFTNVVPMTPELNRGAGSPWRAAETDTIKWAKQYGSVQVQVEPIYDSNPPRLTDGTPIPKAIRRTVTAPDGTVLQDVSFLNR
jgi:DNA/RNA endonuclease G (NUC1)